MRAMVLHQQAPIESLPLQEEEIPIPIPKEKEVRIKVHVCGVCRTDLHLIEGDLPPQTLPMVPGHQVVGKVDQVGPEARRFAVGDRVGIAWLRHTCGICSFCREGRENLCSHSLYTGYHAFGGYAEYAVVDEGFAYFLPESFSDEHAAPLLCAGIIGYRAYKRAAVPKKGKLGIIGFGSSAHITMQVALHHGCEVYVASRDPAHQKLARKLGAAWVGTAEAPFPEKLDSVIVFAPAGSLVPVALASLEKGGTVSLAGIHMSDIPSLQYNEHLFHEKNLCSVEANTREDGRELVALAAEIPVAVHLELFPLQEANEALLAMKEDRIQGTAVLTLLS